MNNDFLRGGNFNKFVVLNINDIRKYLDDKQQNELNFINDEINSGRFNDDKSMNKYIVINTDESYAPEIVEILKKNGHWG